MTQQEMDRILQDTLVDFRLSGSEKQALKNLLNEAGLNEQQRAQWRSRAFEAARAAVLDPQARQTLDWLEEVVKVLLPRLEKATVSEVCFCPGQDCVARIAGLFGKAVAKVDVCVFTITDDRVTQAILAAHRRGVQIRIITDNDKAFDLGSDIERLEAAGIPVRIDKTAFHMHHKFALFDDALLLNGSFNWTRGAAQNNHENFIVTGDRSLVTAFAREFERLWDALR